MVEVESKFGWNLQPMDLYLLLILVKDNSEKRRDRSHVGLSAGGVDILFEKSSRED